MRLAGLDVVELTSRQGIDPRRVISHPDLGQFSTASPILPRQGHNANLFHSLPSSMEVLRSRC